jgi:hypothetical protein
LAEGVEVEVRIVPSSELTPERGLAARAYLGANRWPAPLVARAMGVLADARRDLGHELGGFSPVDLLLDNLPSLSSSDDARDLVAYVEGREPQLGELVRYPSGQLAVVSEQWGPGRILACRLSDVYGGRFFWGPGHGAPSGERDEHVSVSGGPHPAVQAEWLTPSAEHGVEQAWETGLVQCWHWRAMPCAGGGQDYTRRVRIWHCDREVPTFGF